MKTEREKMTAGELYHPLDEELTKARKRARQLCRALDAAGSDAEHQLILFELFAAGGDTAIVQAPFYCDYGSNIYLGERVFFNFNCVILDVCEVRIGGHTLLGARSADLYRPPSHERPRAPTGRIWAASKHRGRCVDRRRCHHSSRGQYWLGCRDRRGQRRVSRYSRQCLRRRQPVSGGTRDPRIALRGSRFTR